MDFSFDSSGERAITTPLYDAMGDSPLSSLHVTKGVKNHIFYDKTYGEWPHEINGCFVHTSSARSLTANRLLRSRSFPIERIFNQTPIWLKTMDSAKTRIRYEHWKRASNEEKNKMKFIHQINEKQKYAFYFGHEWNRKRSAWSLDRVLLLKFYSIRSSAVITIKCEWMSRVLSSMLCVACITLAVSTQ